MKGSNGVSHARYFPKGDKWKKWIQVPISQTAKIGVN